jgi:hypothetical protein
MHFRWLGPARVVLANLVVLEVFPDLLLRIKFREYGNRRKARIFLSVEAANPVKTTDW